MSDWKMIKITESLLRLSKTWLLRIFQFCLIVLLMSKLNVEEKNPDKFYATGCTPRRLTYTVGKSLIRALGRAVDTDWSWNESITNNPSCHRRIGFYHGLWSFIESFHYAKCTSLEHGNELFLKEKYQPLQIHEVYFDRSIYRTLGFFK